MTTDPAEGQPRSTAYLDTNLVIGILERDLEYEQQPFRRLLQAHSEGVLELVTSSVTLEELEKHESEEKREPLLDIYRLLRKITFVAEDDLLWQTIGRPGQSRVYGPLPVKAADLERLKTILPDADDARHLFQAARNGIDYFVTGDQDTILKHWEEVEIAVSIRVCSPSDLVYELGL